MDAAQECLDAGSLAAADAVTLARHCWTSAHGVTALEVNELLGGDDHESFAERAFALVVEAHRPKRA